MSDDPNDFTNRLADARLVYEETHGMTMHELAEVIGMPKKALETQRRAEGWMKQVKSGQSTEAAAAVVRFAEWKALAELRSAAAAREPATGVMNLAAPMVEDHLRELLDRHKKEWMAPRAIATEAMKIRDTDPAGAFQKAKLAKISAETLELVQRGERRAFGIDDRETPHGSVVVIERSGND